MRINILRNNTHASQIRNCVTIRAAPSWTALRNHLGLNEGDLWRRFKSGDKEAFSRIYISYFNTLYNYGCKVHKSKDAVKDCIQDLFFELWRRKEHLGDTDSIKFYLLKSLRRKIVREIEKDATSSEKAEMASCEHLDFVFPYESDLINEQARIERSERLSRAFSTLSSRQKEILFLRFFNDMTVDEIASIMSINYQSVHNLIFRAITQLRKQLAPEYLIALICAFVSVL
jgi:RNA polymerase sigma factor (sigma-70 family)